MSRRALASARSLSGSVRRREAHAQSRVDPPATTVLGTSYDGDSLAKLPLLDEVAVALNSQGDAHGAVRPVDLTHDFCLDLVGMLREMSQDNVTELQSLNLHLHRHQTIVRLAGRMAVHPNRVTSPR